MRLLYCTSDGRLNRTDDLMSGQIPPYAILSHTWEGQEVTFRGLRDHSSLKEADAKLKAGYKKLFFCAEQAKRDGLDHFWVDTCCIDKSNSQELQEAINSMFRWYQNAKKCYVFLSDVEHSTLDGSSRSALMGSRWFTRGWTLQELLAPISVEFFSVEGIRLGDKALLKDIIHEITGIPVEALPGDRLSDFSIDSRFSWAEKRQTSREEDRAYCLLGIFGVHLPLIYSEGEENALDRLRDAIMTKNNRGQRLDKLINWITAPDPFTNHQKAHNQRQAETGLWFLDSTKFTEWKEGPASRVWLYGIPGCGKTILSSTIIEHLLQRCDDDINIVTAYFYFDFNDIQKQDPELMLRSLLQQLLGHSSTVCKCLDQMFSSCENDQRQPTLNALLEVIPQVIHQFKHVYIVLDALDECTQRLELLHLLKLIDGWQLSNMHLLVASRKERDIEDSLRDYVREEDVVDLQRDVVDKDILHYVQQRLSDDKGLAKWNKDATIRQEIEDALMRGARGMFRWAVCQLDTLVQCRNRATLRRTLATLPQTLDQTYNRILCAISKEDYAYAMRILQWLTFSMRPLRVEEIAEVVAIDAARNPAFDREEVLEDPLEVLNICSSLVTISTIKADEESDPLQQIVSLAHYSVQEYLVSDRIKQGPAKQYSTHEVECHSMITKGSLRYLIQLQQPLSKEIVYTSALARYAAEFWSSHLRKATEETKELTQAAMGLMSIDVPAYLTWIQLYDPDSPWLQPDLNKGLDSAAAPLYYAALLGLSTIVKMLLAQGAEINIQGGRYGNALHAASIKGHTQVVRILLNAGADIDAQSEDHGSILQAASCEGHEQIVKVLIDNGADINKQSSRDNSAIQSASASGHLKIAQLLLDNGADVNKQGGLYGNALNAAAAEGHIAIVQLLLKNGAEISEHDSQGKSVLHHATNNAYCSLILVEFLLSQGAPANTTDTNNMTPLHYSVKFNNKSIATLLLNSGVSIDTGVHRKPWSPNTVKTDTSCQISFPGSEPNISRISSGLTPLHFAALTGNSIMTKFLLNHGADPNALSIYSESPMHLALRETLHGPKYEDDWTNPHWRVECLFDHADFVEEDGVESIHENITRHREGVLGALLADARTSLAIGDYQNEHPLHCVKYRKSAHVCIVKELVSRGALLSERNMKQQSALHLASRAGDHDAAVFLLSVGVDPALKDNEGLNTIHHAARSGDHETIAVLLETAGATRPSLVAAKDTRGRNALHHLLSTTSQVRKETIQLLLDKGVDGLELDVSGKSPLASYFGRQHWLGINIDIFQLLLSVKGSSSYVDQNGQNLGHLCVKTRECRVQVFELLTQHGVDLTQKDFQGRTVLHCAAISGSLTEKTLHHLLHVIGLALDAQDVEGKTALQHAAEMASKDHHRHIFDYKRWYRTTKLLLESEVSHTASRTIVG